MFTANQEYFIYGGTITVYALIDLVLGLILTFNIFKLKENTTPLMRMGGLAMLCDFLDVAGHTTTYEFFYTSEIANFVPHIFDVLVALFLFWAGVSLLTEKYPSKKIMLFSLVPFVIHIASYFFYDPIYSILAGTVCILFIVGYIVIGLKLYRLDKGLLNYYSDIENRRKTWFFLFVILFNLETVFYYLRSTLYIDSMIIESIYNVFMIFTFTFFAYNILTQNKGITKECIEEDKKIAEEILTKKTTQGSKYLNREQEALLKDYMVTQKAYLDPELTVDKITTLLNTNTAYLYYYFRETLNTKFYDYVNGFRVAEAKKLLEETDKKIVAIALESGFKSAHSFTRVFKQHTGMLPSDWRKNTEKDGVE